MMKFISLIYYLTLTLFVIEVDDARAQDKIASDLDFTKILLPPSKTSIFQDDNYFIWCGTMVRTEDGICHLFYSRWPKVKGFNGWVTDSEVAHAVSAQPLGPYKFKNVTLPKRDKKYWDADVTHNPTVMKFGKKFYLYYMGNKGDGAFWNHRNHQRIGVAVANHPNGPWKRLGKPVIDVTPGSWDHLMTSNPSVTRRQDGKFLIVYKGVSDGKLPFGGKVKHGVAIANSPEGPFIKQPNTIFDHEGSEFAAEDPFVWIQRDKYYAVVKDMKGNFTRSGPSLALFESKDGLEWQVAAHPLVSGLTIQWIDGKEEKVQRLERPQLWFENGKPRVLFVAIKKSDSTTYNLAIPIVKN